MKHDECEQSIWDYYNSDRLCKRDISTKKQVTYKYNNLCAVLHYLR